MLKETAKSLKIYFIVVAIISMSSAASIGSRPDVPASIIVLAMTGMLFGFAYAYIALRLQDLLASRAWVIKAVLTANLAFVIAGFLLALRTGLVPTAVVRLLISTLLYVYLMKSVSRLAIEASTPKA